MPKRELGGSAGLTAEAIHGMNGNTSVDNSIAAARRHLPFRRSEDDRPFAIAPTMDALSHGWTTLSPHTHSAANILSAAPIHMLQLRRAQCAYSRQCEQPQTNRKHGVETRCFATGICPTHSSATQSSDSMKRTHPYARKPFRCQPSSVSGWKPV